MSRLGQRLAGLGAAADAVSWRIFEQARHRNAGWLERHRQRSLRRVLERGATAPLEAVTVAVVGRRRNASYLQALANQFPGPDWRVWGLDGPVPGFEAQTVGAGPGAKFELIDRLLAAAPIPRENSIVVADDDVFLGTGSARRLLETGSRAGFDLYQPAHRWDSFYTHRFLVLRPGVTAERGTFVEIGPLFVIGPGGRDRLVPFGAGVGMGYGLELRWWEMCSAGELEMGVVGDCRLVHCIEPGLAYEVAPEVEQLREELSRVELEHLTAAQVRRGRWWRWQSSPPWCTAADPHGATT